METTGLVKLPGANYSLKLLAAEASASMASDWSQKGVTAG